MAAEFGEPQWVFGMSSYGFEPGGSIVCTIAARRPARSSPGSTPRPARSPRSRRRTRRSPSCASAPASPPSSAARRPRPKRSSGSTSRAARARCCAARARSPWPTPTSASPSRSPSRPRAAASPTPSSTRRATARFAGPPGAKPPLLVVSHGGPTGSTDPALRLSIQYWTSRGFAVVDVNYGGCSGHGRAYRERLNGRWGIVDVDDVVNAARFLVGARRRRRRRAWRSAAAAPAATRRWPRSPSATVFHAGASHYGISDLETLARDTHKFESRYLDSLVGPYPERADLYRARSPIHYADRLASALILFQGDEDKAVPPSQAEAMYEAVRAKGLPVAYLLFAGEQHGFRRAANIRRALEAELWFYGRVFGFAPADAIEPVELGNAPPPAAA